jgi:hypothetical protein
MLAAQENLVIVYKPTLKAVKTSEITDRHLLPS